MPPKNQFVNKLHEDQEVHDTFVALYKQVSAGRTGKNYLRVTLGDRSGQIEARVWDNADEIARRFQQGDLVYVSGLVTSYQGVLQLKAQCLEKVDEADGADWADFLPAAARPAAEMWVELAALLDTIRNPWLKRLLATFTDDADWLARFHRATAAKAMHHAYVAGLLEHTLSLVTLADNLSGLYPVNRDLLLTGAFLHDIGKMDELVTGAGFDYTDEGKLIGHIAMGAREIQKRIEAIDGFPPKLALHLDHMILSHHGEMEWGAVKRPKTIEALVLHAMDNLDAKVAAAVEAIEGEQSDSDWTGYLRIFERPFYRPVLEGEEFGERGEPAEEEGSVPVEPTPVVEEPAPVAKASPEPTTPDSTPSNPAPEEESEEDSGQGSLF